MGGERALTWGRGWGGVRGMNQTEEFSRIVAAILARFFAQNGRAALAESVARAVGARLWEAAEAHGWPRALAAVIVPEMPSTVALPIGAPACTRDASTVVAPCANTNASP